MRKVEVTLVDDMDGSEAYETVSFAIDRFTYEIDLSDNNATHLREFLATYIGSARRITAGSAKPNRARSVNASEPKTETVRQWAIDHGYRVKLRGRVPRSIRADYDAEHIREAVATLPRRMPPRPSESLPATEPITEPGEPSKSEKASGRKSKGKGQVK